MLYLLKDARQRLRLAARNGVVTAIAAVLFLIGAGFAIAACWIALARQWGTLEATGALAAAFVVLSGLVLLMRRSTPPAPQPRPAPPPPPPPGPNDPSRATILLEAFMLGQRLAEQSRRRRDR